MVMLGEYYKNKENLVRTITRAINDETGETMLVYAIVGNNGCISQAHVMTEERFSKEYSAKIV